MAAERTPVVLPPWLIANLAREPLRETFARARWLLATYWLLTGSGYAVLVLTAITWWHGEATYAVALILSSLIGALVGNLLGLLRLRTWVVQVAIHVLLAVGTAALMGAAPLAIPAMFSALWSVGCGHIALQRRFSLASLWIPVICWTAAIITVLERNGRLHTWQAGHKEGVWQPLTFAMLFLVVAEFFVFLAGQESYHGQVWQAGAVTTPVRLTKQRAVGATRVTKRGIFAVLTFALVATLLTAKIAPYLWRTGPQERGNRDDEPRPSDRPREAPNADWDALGRALERAAREAAERAKDTLPFLPLFLLNRPLRRLWLLRHWRKPVYPVTPTEQATNLWRYVVIALGDVECRPKTGETHEQAVERLIQVRAASGGPLPEGLAETRELYERVRFGLGIPTGAIEALQAEAERAFESVRAPMSAWQRVKCWWRKIEV
jgi:hypothetical protein